MKKAGSSKILCLSLWSPPAIRPQAFLIEKLIHEWDKQNLSPILVSYDINEKSTLPCTHICIPQYKPLNLFGRTSTFFRIHKLVFHIKTIFKLYQISKAHNIDLIFSFSNPIDSNIWGSCLKKLLKKPFISHFSDPFVDNPLKSFSFIQKQINLRLETFIIKTSDAVVFTNKNQEALMLSKYSKKTAEKSHIIPHAFSPSLYPQKAPISNKNKFTISHIGAFYPNRTPEPLFKALARLPKTTLQLVNIELIGGINPYSGYSENTLKALISAYNLNDSVTLEAPVSYHESLSKMTQSDLLIVIDPPLENSPFLPSKLIDYIGSQTPILAITPKNSPTHLILDTLNYPVFLPQQTAEIARILEDILTGSKTFNTSSIETYQIETVAKQWRSLFDQMLSTT